MSLVAETRSEEQLVHEWRAFRLEVAGLPVLAASSLASTRIDIEEACRVVRAVLAAGKPYELALEILL